MDLILGISSSIYIILKPVQLSLWVYDTNLNFDACKIGFRWMRLQVTIGMIVENIKYFAIFLEIVIHYKECTILTKMCKSLYFWDSIFRQYCCLEMYNLLHLCLKVRGTKRVQKCYHKQGQFQGLLNWIFCTILTYDVG